MSQHFKHVHKKIVYIETAHWAAQHPVGKDNIFEGTSCYEGLLLPNAEDFRFWIRLYL